MSLSEMTIRGKLEGDSMIWYELATNRLVKVFVELILGYTMRSC